MPFCTDTDFPFGLTEVEQRPTPSESSMVSPELLCPRNSYGVEYGVPGTLPTELSMVSPEPYGTLRVALLPFFIIPTPEFNTNDIRTLIIPVGIV